MLPRYKTIDFSRPETWNRKDPLRPAPQHFPANPEENSNYGLNVSCIISGRLYLGARRAACNPKLLKELNIAHVVNATEQVPSYFAETDSNNNAVEFVMPPDHRFLNLMPHTVFSPYSSRSYANLLHDTVSSSDQHPNFSRNIDAVRDVHATNTNAPSTYVSATVTVTSLSTASGDTTNKRRHGNARAAIMRAVRKAQIVTLGASTSIDQNAASGAEPPENFIKSGMVKEEESVTNRGVRVEDTGLADVQISHNQQKKEESKDNANLGDCIRNPIAPEKKKRSSAEEVSGISYTRVPLFDELSVNIFQYFDPVADMMHALLYPGACDSCRQQVKEDIPLETRFDGLCIDTMSQTPGDEVYVGSKPMGDVISQDNAKPPTSTHCSCREPKRVLVHCLAGKSRSASLVIAYLIKYGLPSKDGEPEGYKFRSFSQVMRYVKTCRILVQPNQSFQYQLYTYWKLNQWRQRNKQTTK